MSIELVERAAAALGPELLEEVAFLGAASIPLWITEEAAPPARPTRDVDVVVEVGSLIAYYAVGVRLRERGFAEDPKARQICAWNHEADNVHLDVMPTEAEILGFGTKLEAFRGRGRDADGEPDYLGSRDFGDIVFLVDGRVELVDEVLESPSAGHLLPDQASQARRDIVLERIARMLP